MTAGRPRKIGNEYCPQCGELGFSYPNSVKKSAQDIYFYLRFRHNNRKIKDHDIDSKIDELNQLPLKYGMEYHRKSKQVALFGYKSYDNDKYYPLKRYSENKTLPIVIYDFAEISDELRPKLNQLWELTIRDEERDWLLNSKEVKEQPHINRFYNNVLKDNSPEYIVTFGEKAIEYEDKLLKFPFTGNVLHLLDKFGMLHEVLKRRERKKKLSESCEMGYNYPQRTTAELVTQKECVDN